MKKTKLRKIERSLLKSWSIASTAILLVVGLTIHPSGASISNANCVPPPDGLVSWWPMDDSYDDIISGNNPSQVYNVSIAPAKVGNGVTFGLEDGLEGYIEIQNSPNLNLQRFTVNAWVKPMGAGPNNDLYGSVIIEKRLQDAWASSISLLWSAISNRFVFVFGHVINERERIFSNNRFPAGQFYNVTATYDGNIFKLYVNAVLEKDKTLQKRIIFDSSVRWSIGSTSQHWFDHINYPRTWNGVIDEIAVANRALSEFEIQSIYEAQSYGMCKYVPVSIDIKPGSYPNCFNIDGHGVIPVAILGSADLDINDIDIDSLSFAGLSVRVRGNKGPLCSAEYANDDEFLDLVCHFEDDPSNWVQGSDTADLSGNLLDGTFIKGTDSICVVP